jgi:predicted outer membrane repeat protein
LGGDTIEVSDATYDESITFPSGKVITLRSVNGASSTIIRGNDGSNTVSFGGSLVGTTLEGFTITHAGESIGRGIYIGSGNLIVDNCTISGNTADDNGGGIYNSGTLTITRSTISDNTAEWIDGSQYSTGGGIDTSNGSTLTITGSTIFGNSADWGGGIINSPYSTLTITGSTIFGNSADWGGGGIYLFQPEAIITIGGENTADKNTICGNYKTGEDPSLDQQIRDNSGSLYETYKDTNNVSAYCE